MTLSLNLYILVLCGWISQSDGQSTDSINQKKTHVSLRSPATTAVSLVAWTTPLKLRTTPERWTPLRPPTTSEPWTPLKPPTTTVKWVYPTIVTPEDLSVFRAHVQSRKAYVDKTGLIEEILNHPLQAIVFSRPPKCGKSMNLDMMMEFFREDRRRENLFASYLKIMQNPYRSLRQEFMNKYPVMYLSFKSMGKCTTHESAKRALHLQVRQLLIRFEYLLASDKVYRFYKRRYRRILNGTEGDFEDRYAVNYICKMLYYHHGKAPILIFDDIDAWIEPATVHKYLDITGKLMEQFFTMILRSTSFYKKAILAGVQPITLYLPEIRIFTIEDEEFEPYFGFTEKDIQSLLQRNYQGADYDLKKQIKDWYSYYHTGKQMMYNPSSVLKDYTENWKIQSYAKVLDYLENRHISTHFLKGMGTRTAMEFQVLLSNSTLKKRVAVRPQFDCIFSSENMMWSYFLHSGIITVKEFPFKENNALVSIAVIGLDIRNMLKKGVIEPLVRQNLIPDYDRFIKMVEEGDGKEVRNMMQLSIKNAGPLLYTNEGKTLEMENVADYIETLMTGWMDHFGGKMTTSKKEKERLMKFHQRDGTVKMRVRIHQSLGFWEKMKKMIFREDLVMKAGGLVISAYVGGSTSNS